MATQIGLCNAALSHLGDEANVQSIDPPEASPQAQACAQFYPLALGELLERHEWNFATTRATLSALSETYDGWLFCYAAPSDMVRPQAVIHPTWRRHSPIAEYVVEVDPNGNLVILTDQYEAILKYTQAVEDPTKFPPLFASALEWLLAAKLAGPILRGDAARTATAECLQEYERYFGLASASDARSQRVNLERNPDWIRARRGGYPWGGWGDGVCAAGDPLDCYPDASIIE